MQTIMDFLANNYIWFIIITVILVFSLIGYLVDTSKEKNTDGENDKKPEVKSKKEKPKKDKKNKGKKEDILEDNVPTIEEVLSQSQTTSPAVNATASASVSTTPESSQTSNETPQTAASVNQTITPPGAPEVLLNQNDTKTK